MMSMKWLMGIGAIALLGITTACTTPPEPSEADMDTDAVPESMAGRSEYSEIPLPPEAERFGPDPKAITLAALGIDTPAEGNFNQEVTVVEQTPEMEIVTLTQTGLLDDSVEGMRYWLEFEAGDDAWEMVWAGRQVRCYPGRGSQEWSTELCS